MSTDHTIEEGESLLSIALDAGLLPESIWNDPANADINRKRKDPDRLRAGDVLHIRDRQTKEEQADTEKRHRYYRHGSLGVIIRLDIDPSEAASHEDRFVLESTDGSYSSAKTVRDDLVPGDRYVDLLYSGLHASKSYRLKVTSTQDSSPEIVFDNVPYRKLTDVSPGAAGGTSQDRIESSSTDDSDYAEEPDQEEHTG